MVIVVGLALFAFIAGDAWQVMRPHQSQDVGEVNGESISAQDYQKMVEEYTEVVKIARNVNSLTDEEVSRLQDEVWQTYVENKLIENEAKTSQSYEQGNCDKSDRIVVPLHHAV